MTAQERWLATMWPVVRELLPGAPARVVELGCGSLGGFVPKLRSDGYDAVGVDPQAPDGDEYLRVEFELATPFADLDAIVASTSLHHVADPAEVLDLAAAALAPGGSVVVIEWAWEELDDPTAEWGFERVRPDGEPGWLHRRRDEWLASGQPWSVYLAGWARQEGLHEAGTLLRLLDERFERVHVARGPYLFSALADTTAETEAAAIESGRIRATRVDYAGRLRR